MIRRCNTNGMFVGHGVVWEATDVLYNEKLSDANWVCPTAFGMQQKLSCGEPPCKKLTRGFCEISIFWLKSLNKPIRLIDVVDLTSVQQSAFNCKRVLTRGLE